MSFYPITKFKGYETVKNLIKKFDVNYSEYTKNNSKYNESQARSDFIDPFFEALNWDLKNNKNLPNYVREVILEDSVENESTHQNPDYGFQAGTEKKFFVEAKKPSVKIEFNQKTAYQARSYGWTDKHNISILTNFEFLIIFDTTVRPEIDDNSSICRLKIYNYKDYLQKFDEIYDLISRDAVFSGNFDKKTKKLVTLQSKSSPDQFLLEQINRWRIKLATNLINNNPRLDEIQINDLVQQLINRIIFLRICEDRTLEKHETLLNTAKTKSHSKFLELLKLAEEKYDSDLFESSGTTLPITINSQNNDILEIIEELYYPKSPFSFRVIESNILGNVYEMFLTEELDIVRKPSTIPTIQLKKRPEHEKRDVIHTPTHIIKKIVNQTLEEKCKNKHPEEVQKIRILDPAVGSGSFLIEALEYLINYVTDWYSNKKDYSKVYETKGGWVLKLKEKMKLISCLRGVDIDFNAVDVTKFALCVKLMENETKSTISSMTKILPKLNNNIVCGNSVVDENIWNIIDKSKLSQSQIDRVNVFSWKKSFQDISNAKFDVIIGNPPYMKTEDMKKFIPIQLEFFKKYYSSVAKGQFDKYFIFIKKSIELLQDDGNLGFIVAHKFMKIKAGEGLRTLLSQNNYVKKIVDFGTQQIFENRTTYTCLLFLKKETQTMSDFEYIQVTDIDKWKIDSKIGMEKNVYQSNSLTSEQWVFLTPNEQKSWDQIHKNSIMLNDNLVAEPFTGIQSSRDSIYIIKKWTQNGDLIEFTDKDGTKRAIEKDILKPYLLPANRGKESFKSFETITNDGWVIFPYEVKNGKAKTLQEDTFRQKFPNAYHYLSAFKRDLIKRNLDEHSKDWYRFGRSQALTTIENQPKIIVGVLFKEERYIYDDRDIYFQTGDTAGYVGIKMRKNSPYSIFYILGLLNHSALEWVSSKKASTFERDYIAHGQTLLRELPIRKIDFSNPYEQKMHDQIVQMVKEIIKLHKNKKNAITERDRSLIIKNISEKRAELDKVINSLYGIDNLIKYAEVP